MRANPTTARTPRRRPPAGGPAMGMTFPSSLFVISLSSAAAMTLPSRAAIMIRALSRAGGFRTRLHFLFFHDLLDDTAPRHATLAPSYPCPRAAAAAGGVRRRRSAGAPAGPPFDQGGGHRADGKHGGA